MYDNNLNKGGGIIIKEFVENHDDQILLLAINFQVQYTCNT